MLFSGLSKITALTKLDIGHDVRLYDIWRNDGIKKEISTKNFQLILTIGERMDAEATKALTLMMPSLTSLKYLDVRGK